MSIAVQLMVSKGEACNCVASRALSNEVLPGREGLAELSALAGWPDRLDAASDATSARLDCPGAHLSRVGKDSRPAESTQGCLCRRKSMSCAQSLSHGRHGQGELCLVRLHGSLHTV